MRPARLLDIAAHACADVVVLACLAICFVALAGFGYVVGVAIHGVIKGIPLSLLAVACLVVLYAFAFILRVRHER